MKNKVIPFCKKHALVIFLVGGFIFDNLTLRRTDRLAENLVLLAYLILAFFFIFVVNNSQSGGRLKFWSGAALQFCFGNLFSAFVIFYWRSGALAAVWPILALFVAMMIGNEVLKKYYERLTFQIAVFYLALFSFLVFFIPILLKNINTWVFLVSGLVSLVVVYLLVRLLFWQIGEQSNQSRRPIIASVVSIYIAINILYFTNLIPPIPLAMKDAGVYHSVARSGSGYEVVVEKESWLAWLWPGITLHVAPGGSVYVFSAIFSPSQLDTTIVHNWQYYDTIKEKWQDAGKIMVPVVGGRLDGYRLYSAQSVRPGSWRVDVETVRGQVIGRIKFKVALVSKTPTLITKIK